MQTVELEAGVELDALIAEKVMGWRNWTGGDHSSLIGGTWSPSTDIAAAWHVVEHLRERFPQIDIEILPDRVTVTLWERCRHDGDALDPLDEVVAGSAPLAICRAALAAVGH